MVTQKPDPTESSHESTSKVRWVDIGKGIGILQVVWYHASGAAFQEPSIGLPPELLLIRKFTHSYNMPFFFFMAGIFASRLLKKSPAGLASTLGRRVVYPYLLWSVLQAVWLTRFGLDADRRAELIRLLSEYVIVPHYQFWFLYVLFFFVCIYYIVGRWRAGPWVLLLVGLVLRLLPLMTGIVIGGVQRVLFFYAAGAVIGPLLVRREFGARPRIAIGLLGLLLIAELFNPDPSDLLAFVYAIAGTVGLVLLAHAIEMGGGNAVLERIGRNSLKIYLAHVIGICEAGAILKRLRVTDPWIHVTTGILAGLIFPLALAIVAKWCNFSSLFELKAGFNRQRSSVSSAEDSGEALLMPDSTIDVIPVNPDRVDGSGHFGVDGCHPA
jgi:uncharacterized membrane protein YcfT